MPLNNFGLVDSTRSGNLWRSAQPNNRDTTALKRIGIPDHEIVETLKRLEIARAT
jgi:hypothetical protein